MFGPDVPPPERRSQPEQQNGADGAERAGQELSPQVYLAMAHNHAFHCRYRPPRSNTDNGQQQPEADGDGDGTDSRGEDEDVDRPPKDNNEVAERELLEFASCNPKAVAAFARLFPKAGTTITFEDGCLTFSWTEDRLAFMSPQYAAQFIRLVKPKIARLVFQATRFLRSEIITIANELLCAEEEILDDRSLLQFRQPSNDNAYATLIEKVGARFRRIQIDDEFIPHLQMLNQHEPYDYLKVIINTKVDTTYIKAYFELPAVELDIHRVANIPNILEFDPILFRMQPNEIFRTLWISLASTETGEVLDRFAERLRFLAPNLERLVLVQGLALKFSTWNNVDELRSRVHEFVNTAAPGIVKHFDERLQVDFRLEVSVYAAGAACTTPMDWTAELKRLESQNVRIGRTDVDTEAHVFSFNGPRVGQTTTVRVHSIEKEYNNSEVPAFLHGTPIDIA